MKTVVNNSIPTYLNSLKLMVNAEQTLCVILMLNNNLGGVEKF